MLSMRERIVCICLDGPRERRRKSSNLNFRLAGSTPLAKEEIISRSITSICVVSRCFFFESRAVFFVRSSNLSCRFILAMMIQSPHSFILVTFAGSYGTCCRDRSAFLRNARTRCRNHMRKFAPFRSSLRFAAQISADVVYMPVLHLFIHVLSCASHG